ncbi:SUKH-3 domain-containing protein, partial [Streptomyces lonegramiae]
LHITASAPGRQIAPAAVHVDPLHGLHLARTLGDLGRALESEVAPLGAEGEEQAVLAIDTEGRVYSIDHTGDWFLGKDIDEALATLITGTQPARLTSSPSGA